MRIICEGLLSDYIVVGLLGKVGITFSAEGKEVKSYSIFFQYHSQIIDFLIRI